MRYEFYTKGFNFVLDFRLNVVTKNEVYELYNYEFDSDMNELTFESKQNNQFKWFLFIIYQFILIYFWLISVCIRIIIVFVIICFEKMYFGLFIFILYPFGVC